MSISDKYKYLKYSMFVKTSCDAMTGTRLYVDEFRPDRRYRIPPLPTKMHIGHKEIFLGESLEAHEET